MSSPQTPDPYAALGLTKDATAQQIKSTYRKLVLKCHPDKVTDDALKPAAVDIFHRIQTAYEILSDEDRRSKYDASVRLAELKKDLLAQRQSRSPSRQYAPNATPPTHFTPNDPPRPAAYDTTRGNERYETMRPRAYAEPTAQRNAYSDEDAYFPQYSPNRTSSRKPSHSEKDSKKQRSKAEADRKHTKDGKSSRHDGRKSKDKERTRDREAKTPRRVVLDDSDSETDKRDRPREAPQQDGYRPAETADVDSMDQRMREARAHILFKTSRRSDDTKRSSSRVDRLKSEHVDPPRRSSAKSPIGEKPSRPDLERARQNSEPQNMYRPPDYFATNREPRPPFTETYSSPADKFPTERKVKAEAAKSRYHEDPAPLRRADTDPRSVQHDMPPLKRSDTEPSRQKRPEMPPRSDSKRGTEFKNGMPTPGTSPPYDWQDPFAAPQPSRRPAVRSTSYVIDEHTNGVRPMSPRATDRRRRVERSPSPEPRYERKNRSSGERQTSRTYPSKPPLFGEVPPSPSVSKQRYEYDDGYPSAEVVTVEPHDKHSKKESSRSKKSSSRPKLDRFISARAIFA